MVVGNANNRQRKSRKKRSWCWNFFDEKTISNNEVVCLKCKKGEPKVTYVNSSTSTLIYHLVHTHNITNHNYKRKLVDNHDVYLERYVIMSETDSEFSSDDNEMTTYNYSNVNEKKKIIDEKLTNFIVNGNLPISVVNNESFQKFVEILNSNYKLPSRHTITKQILPHMVWYSTIKRCFSLNNKNFVFNYRNLQWKII